MAINLTPERAEAILAIVRRYPDGATIADIGRDLPGAPEPRKLRGWIENIALGGGVTLEGTGDATIVRLSARATASVVSTAPSESRRVVAGVADPGRAAPDPVVAAVRDRGPSTAAPSPASVPSAAPPPHPVVAGVADRGRADPGPVVAAVRDRAPSTATPSPATPPAPSDPPPPSADAASDQMMLEAVQYVVAYGIVPETSTFHLQGAARKEGLSLPAAIAFVDRLVAYLATLSAADAVTLYGLSAAQYAEWVEHCSLAGYPRRGARASDNTTAAPEPSAAPSAPPPPAPPLGPAHPAPRTLSTPRPTPPASAAPRPVSPPHPHPPANPVVTAPRDRGAAAGTPRRHTIADVVGGDLGVAGVAGPGPVAAAVRDRGPEPSAATAATCVPPPSMAHTAAAPASSPAAARSRRALSTAAWVSALLVAGLGTYQIGNHLSSASAPAAAPVLQPPSAPVPVSNVATPAPVSISSPIENRDSNTEAAKRPTSAIENPFPAFPASPGAYLLSGVRWLPLPRANAQVLAIDDNREMPPGAAGLLMFTGPVTSPPLSATQAVIAYVGPRGWTAAQLARYPSLQNESLYPPIELAALTTDESDVRSTWWSELFPGVNGIGDRRIPATLEHPTANVTILRPSLALAPGRYSLSCGSQYFELAVE